MRTIIAKEPDKRIVEIFQSNLDIEFAFLPVFKYTTLPIESKWLKNLKNGYFNWIIFTSFRSWQILMDKIAESYCDRIKTIVGLRYFNVFGPREHYKGKMASMIYKLALQIKAGKCPRIFSYGEQSRDHIYVKDVLDANVKAMFYEGFDIFNVGAGIETNFNDLIYNINNALGTSFDPEYFDNPYIGSYQNNTLADMSNTQNRLGFKAKYNVSEGIVDYLKWLDSIGWYDE